MRSLQKISAWGLVSSLLLPFIIGWCILTIEERSVEQNVSHLLAAGIETSLLTVIRIAKEDQQILRWEREDEFEYRGEMYDVVARSESSDSLTFHCWHDVDESEVKEKIQHFLARLKGDATKQSLKNQMLHLLQSLIISPGECEYELQWSLEVSQPEHYTLYPGRLAEEPTIPPPKSVFRSISH